MKSRVIILCLGFALFISACSFPRKEWTKLILTHHWPQTFCSMEKCAANFSYWTLHGLWPNYGADCNISWHFNASLIKGLVRDAAGGINVYNTKHTWSNVSRSATASGSESLPTCALQDLLPEMKTFWPNLLNPESTVFWKHEWTKHGTCAAKAEVLDSQPKYFSKALELYHKLDLNGVLKKSNIVPSENYYKLADVEGSISNSYGVIPKIQCVSHKERTFQTIGQLEICFDKQFQLVDCEKSTEELQSRGNEGNQGFSVCDASLPVYYPPLRSMLKKPHFL